MITWKAYFNDHTPLRQFDADGNETPFSKVMEKVDDLKALSISLPGGYSYEVSLVDCSFTINGVQVYILDPTIYPPNKLTNIRPIYFRRCSANINIATNKSTSDTSVTFTAIGFQAIFEGCNIKRFLAVFDDGHIEVREVK